MTHSLRLKAACVAFTAAALFASEAQAAHGSYNPMMPRQLREVSARADHAYGYTVLSGQAIDTLDEVNRASWYLNYDILDNYVLRPVAHGYAALPEGFRSGVGNFLNNLGEINNVPNNALVGEFGGTARSLSRFVINSTIGVLGIFDPATAMGIEAAPLSMATVLGKGGVEQGPFIMVPAYGPTTARDLHGAAVDGVPFMFLSWPVTMGKWVISGVHNRASLIDQEALVDNALDPYVQTRDAYLMYDENKVNPVADGEVESTDDFDDELLDEIDSM